MNDSRKGRGEKKHTYLALLRLEEGADDSKKINKYPIKKIWTSNDCDGKRREMLYATEEVLVVVEVAEERGKKKKKKNCHIHSCVKYRCHDP